MNKHKKLLIIFASVLALWVTFGHRLAFHNETLYSFDGCPWLDPGATRWGNASAAKIIQNILSDGFVFNLFKKPDLLFHNWIFEMYWRINIFVFPFIICCMWTFINLRKFSINAYLMGIVLISGLFSFELDVVVYSALTFMMAAIIDRQNQYILEVSKVD